MVLYLSAGLTELQSHYSVLVRSMPDDYMNTVSQLERHLTGDHIGSILECRDVFTANQRILDCLVEQLGGEKDAFDLCNWLSVITNAPLLTAAIDDFKKGIIPLWLILLRNLCMYWYRYNQKMFIDIRSHFKTILRYVFIKNAHNACVSKLKHLQVQVTTFTSKGLMGCSISSHAFDVQNVPLPL